MALPAITPTAVPKMLLQNPPPEEAGAVFVVWLMIVVFFLTIVFGAEGRGTPRRG